MRMANFEHEEDHHYKLAGLRENFEPKFDDESNRCIFTDREIGEVGFEAVGQEGIYPNRSKEASLTPVGMNDVKRGKRILKNSFSSREKSKL